MKPRDLTGQRFGRLTVLHRGEDQVDPSGKRHTTWVCQCDCGNQSTVITDALLRGRTKSCGCWRKQYLSQSKSTHAESDSPLYGVWCNIKQRCLCPTCHAYPYYGGRGITVCEEWRNSFEVFRDWAYANGYRSGLTIDRINVNGNYEPDNCTWVTRRAQANNRRSNVLLTYNGETHNLMEWAEKLHKNYKTLHTRLSVGWSVERILTT